MDRRVTELRNRANRCLSMAANASDRLMRAEFQELAKQWLELAAEQERFLKIQEELDTIRKTQSRE